MLTVGDKIPSLTLPVQQGTSALPADETIDLGQTNGKWKVLFYWPKDFTFVCPTEIVGYGDLKADFADRDADLIGASTDTAHVHYAWHRQGGVRADEPGGFGDERLRHVHRQPRARAAGARRQARRYPGRRAHC